MSNVVPMKEPEITLSELLAELERTHTAKNGGRGMGILDICEHVPWGENKTRRLVKKAIQAGLMEAYSEKRPNEMRPGWNYWATCYRVKR